MTAHKGILSPNPEATAMKPQWPHWSIESVPALTKPRAQIPAQKEMVISQGLANVFSRKGQSGHVLGVTGQIFNSTTHLRCPGRTVKTKIYRTGRQPDLGPRLKFADHPPRNNLLEDDHRGWGWILDPRKEGSHSFKTRNELWRQENKVLCL